jgi:MSHA pilin protein MshC
MRARGFTLIELVMTVTVIAALAVFALPRMALLEGYNAVGYRDQVVSTLQFARKAAVAQRRLVCVQLAGSDLTLTIDNADPATSTSTCTTSAGLPRALSLPSADSRCAGATNQVCNPAGITLSAAAGAATAALTFSASGQPSAGTVFTVAGTSSTTITVEAQTGYVH